MKNSVSGVFICNVAPVILDQLPSLRTVSSTLSECTCKLKKEYIMMKTRLGLLEPDTLIAEEEKFVTCNVLSQNYNYAHFLHEDFCNLSVINFWLRLYSHS